MARADDIVDATAIAKRAAVRVVQWWERGLLGIEHATALRRMLDFVDNIESDYDVACGARLDFDSVRDALELVVIIEGNIVAREAMSILPRAVDQHRRSKTNGQD